MRCKGKPRPIFLSPREATAMAQRRLDVVCRPCNMLITDTGISVKPMHKKNGEFVGWWVNDTPVLDSYLIEGNPPPYRPGDVVPCKEAWWIANYGNTWRGILIDYYAGGDVKIIAKPKGHIGKLCCWRPAIIMPSWAVRHHRTVKSVECVRVKDVPVLAIEASGIIHLPANRHYATGILEGHDYQTPFKVEWLTRYPSHPFESAWAWVITFEEGE